MTTNAPSTTCRNDLGSISTQDFLATCRPAPVFASWDDLADNLDNRQCLCCDDAGHWQRQVEAEIAEHGLTEGVYIEDGVLKDGHHRIVAAMRLGIEQIPLESKDAAGARWIRDHGYVSWENRTVGDR